MKGNSSFSKFQQNNKKCQQNHDCGRKCKSPYSPSHPPERPSFTTPCTPTSTAASSPTAMSWVPATLPLTGSPTSWTSSRNRGATKKKTAGDFGWNPGCLILRNPAQSGVHQLRLVVLFVFTHYLRRVFIYSRWFSVAGFLKHQQWDFYNSLWNTVIPIYLGSISSPIYTLNTLFVNCSCGSLEEEHVIPSGKPTWLAETWTFWRCISYINMATFYLATVCFTGV